MNKIISILKIIWNILCYLILLILSNVNKILISLLEPNLKDEFDNMRKELDSMKKQINSTKEELDSISDFIEGNSIVVNSDIKEINDKLNKI